MYLTLLTSASHFIVLVLSGKSCWGLLLGLMLVVCLRVLIVASSLPQALPALPSCAGCVSGGTWAARAYTQCPSCACPSHWRTSSFIGSSVTAFRLEKEEEQFVVYSKITIAKKKKSKASFTVFCGYQTLAMWQWKLKTPLHRQWMLLSTQCLHNLLSHQVTPAWEVLVCKQFTWHVCRCICTYSVIHTHTEISPAFRAIFICAISFFPLSVQFQCQNQGCGCFYSISTWKWSFQWRTSDVYNILHIFYQLWFCILSSPSSCPLEPYKFPAVSGCAATVHPWAQLSPMLTHLVLGGTSKVMKASAGVLSKPTKMREILKKPFHLFQKKNPSKVISPVIWLYSLHEHFFIA